MKEFDDSAYGEVSVTWRMPSWSRKTFARAWSIREDGGKSLDEASCQNRVHMESHAATMGIGGVFRSATKERA